MILSWFTSFFNIPGVSEEEEEEEEGGGGEGGREWEARFTSHFLYYLAPCYKEYVHKMIPGGQQTFCMWKKEVQNWNDTWLQPNQKSETQSKWKGP